jgi:glycosyltransferase involved in cell wall biosynthesis
MNASAQQRLDQLKQTIWQTRPDLQSLFQDNQDAFEFWLLSAGAQEYLGVAELLVKLPAHPLLSAPAKEALSQQEPILTRFMKELWAQRPDLQQAFDIASPDGQQAFIRWYFITGIVEMGLATQLTPAQQEWLLSAANNMPQVPNILALIWENDGNLQHHFPDTSTENFRQWTREQGQQHYPILKLLRKLVSQQNAVTQSKPEERQTTPARLFGVNLIGYANGQFGIGEDVRMAALACAAADIPFSIYNVEPGMEVEQNDASANAHVSKHLPYAINLFCTTGIETARLAAVEGKKLFDGYYCIGYWPWELPEWPEQWHLAYEWVDEIWASSRFAYQAYVASSPKPVRHMPMAVTVNATEGNRRDYFGLPADDFLFVFSFDFLSSVKRKNPQACVEAFLEAFPEGNEPVGLVVKAMRAKADNPLWQQLQQLAAQDQRIHIINTTLSRSEVLDLYRACDAFVSLHRSEGFGRGIAEAMMLGKPVITTGYSGNLDFTTPGTAALVDHRLVSLAAGDYPFGDNQTWAEPNIHHAAWWMQRLVNTPPLAQRLSDAGRHLTQATYSPAAVGQHYDAVLQPLRHTFNTSRSLSA